MCVEKFDCGRVIRVPKLETIFSRACVAPKPGCLDGRFETDSSHLGSSVIESLLVACESLSHIHFFERKRWHRGDQKNDSSPETLYLPHFLLLKKELSYC